MSMEEQSDEEDIPVVLPSDRAWRLEIYFKMMENQKNPMPAPWPDSVEESEAKRPRVSPENGRSRECRRSIQSAGGLCWSSSDLALAAKLLETPNARFPSITFANVEEKRRVFTLVYDVLRYKSVLNQALNDVYFFTRFPYLKERCHLVWLLFLDLYKRDFTLRDPLDPEVEAAFQSQGLFEIDEVLWQLRVKLAATVSRLRIKCGAHSLCNLLPKHLQVTRSALEENIITGWVNIFKTNLKETCAYLEDLGYIQLPRDREALEPMTYKTDHLLPRFLHIMPNVREELVEAPLLQDHLIIMQERTFCLGPAVMAQLLKDYALSGKVAQTHVNSPITMAYFANLLINNDKIESLLVFGAGYRKEACEQYLRDLGVKNTIVFSENFAGLNPESRVLDNVIAVLATPPNTNSSVVDPVDLAVARGGDLQILQQLTDDDFASTPRGENINKFLRDQRDTLRRGMSKPQIQFIVYETHSRFHCENEEMATNLVNELNNYAREVHLEELRRAQGETQEKERSQTETSDSQAEVPSIKVESDELNLPLPSPVQSVVIPPSDLFEVADLPDLCPNYEHCLDLASDGTYVALIKRKEITRLDPKYMIQMAEARGLFGRPDATPKSKTPGQTARAKAALAALQARSDSMEKTKTKVKVEVDRIAAPTRASLLRDVRPPSAKDCPRFAHHLAHDGTPSYLCQEPIERKTFLTPEEEEELIRRLYTSPRLNLFPPKLYEDLPSIKFWDSPASVIESYLQRKVFQRRLQLAYEYNQSKEPHEQFTQNTLYDSPDRLTKAVNQLTEDINYFTHLTHHSISKEAMKIHMQAGGDDRNKDIWNQIRPEVDFTCPEENMSLGIEKSATDIDYTKLRDNIKKRFSDYKNFYRLQCLRNEDKPPLVQVIDTTPRQSFTEEENIFFNESYLQEQDFLQYDQFSDETSPEEYEESIAHSSKLPLITSTSGTNLKPTVSFEKHVKDVQHRYDGKDSLLPQLPLVPLDHCHQNFNLRGTLLSLKDSIELTHKRLSRSSKISLPKDVKEQLTPKSIASHKDSYKMLNEKLHKIHRESFTESVHTPERNFESSNYNIRASLTSVTKSGRGTLMGHKDSIYLALQRFTSRDRINEDFSCDLCNDRFSRSVQFLCDYHANLENSGLGISQGQGIITQSKSALSHRDSVIITRRKMTPKGNKRSIGCQFKDIYIKEGLLPETQQVPDSGVKGSHKSRKDEVSIKNENVKITPSKLNRYLMNAVQINQVITDKNSIPRY